LLRFNTYEEIYWNTPKQQEKYAVMPGPNQSCVGGELKPGMTGERRQRDGRNVIEGHGYGEFWTYGLGRAFGLEV